MKPVKKLVYAVLLASFLSVNAFGGDQGTPAAPQPNPSPAKIASDETMPTICDPSGCLSTETSDSLFYEALAALLSVY